ASDDGDIRWAAAGLIVRLADAHRDAVGDALRSLAIDGNLNARKMALYCLRDIGCPIDDAIALAQRACADRHSLLKMAALSLLSHNATHDERAASIAIELLDDSDAGVRRCAAVALGHIGENSERVTSALERALSGGDAYLTRAAEGALRR